MEAKNTVVYLLGAGASKGVGLPSSIELLLKIKEWMSQAKNQFARQAIDAVIETLECNDKQVNFEDLLTVIYSLANPHTMDLWPFVARLNDPFDKLIKTQPELFENLYQVILGFVRSQLDVTDIEGQKAHI
jgi:hypothetical protein